MEVFQQDGKVSTVDGVNIQPSFNFCNRKYTIGSNLWRKYEKGLSVKDSPFLS